MIMTTTAPKINIEMQVTVTVDQREKYTGSLCVNSLLDLTNIHVLYM